MLMAAFVGQTKGWRRGDTHVTVNDIKALSHPVLRHRILINYRAEAEGVSVEQVIDRLVEETK